MWGAPPTFAAARQCIAVSPDGSGVFVTGQRGGNGIGYQTVAYDRVTGGELWARYFSGHQFGLAEDVVVSPSGSRVFVTGGGPGGMGTLAYAP
jgi:DNA-binding beta-propeller fold protein YncE